LDGAHAFDGGIAGAAPATPRRVRDAEGAYPVSPERGAREARRGGWGSRGPPALSAFSTIAPINSGQTARGMSWPIPSTVISFAPLIARAVALPPEGLTSG